MSKIPVQIELPAYIHGQLKKISDVSGASIEEILLQTVKAGLPPILTKVPDAFHDDLLALNKLSDRDLLRVVENELPSTAVQDDEHKKADFDLLRRTYALSLLKWRGHPIPPPYEALV